MTRILIVDDEAQIVRAPRINLRNRHYVVVAVDGAEARRGYRSAGCSCCVCVVMGAHTTIRNVATGPRISESTHQFQPLRPLLWASPALTRVSENHQALRLVGLVIATPL
jgi:hypothetical protein